jgi:hypothetical protein
MKSRFPQEVNLGNLKEKGMLQYFYHSPLSTLPVRDVTDCLGKGHKTEPHIEIGAENYLEDCYQNNIKRFLLSDSKYLFLLTTCRNRNLHNHYGNQYIVGYIVKEKWGAGLGKRTDSVFVKGRTKLFEFQVATPSNELFGKNLDRGGIMHNLWLDEEKTGKILARLNDHAIPLQKCVQEIERLDKKRRTCYYDDECMYQKECLRFHSSYGAHS